MKTLSERRSPRLTRRLGNAALALSLTLILSAQDCPLSGGPVAYPAGFAFRTPQRNSQCTAWASGDWVDAGSQLSWMVGGYEPRPVACGFVVRSASNPVTVKAKIRVLCSQVGNDPNPPAGQCNNGAMSSANYIGFTNKSSSASYSQVDTFFYYRFVNDPVDLTYFLALVPYRSRPAAANFDGDYQYKVDVRYQRLGRDPTAAAAMLTVSGQIENAPKVISGPQVVLSGMSRSWFVSAGTYHAALYRIRWSLDNGSPLAYSPGDSVLTTGFSGAGDHNIRALVMLADSVVDTASYNVQLQARAGIAGPSSVFETGYYTWSADDPGTVGSTPTYSWELYDATAATWSALGDGASVTLPVSSYNPSRLFVLRLGVSAAGYVSNSASLQVTNHLVNDCGGLACLRDSVRVPSKSVPPGRVPRP